MDQIVNAQEARRVIVRTLADDRWTKAALARKTGIHPNNVHYALRNRSPKISETLVRMLNALGFETEYVLRIRRTNRS